MAAAFLGKLRTVSMKLRTAKAIVDHSIPNEVWRVLLKPWWVHRNVQHYGLGAPQGIRVPRKIEWLLTRYLAKVLAVRMAPLAWHLAPGFPVDKSNGKPGIDGQRLVVTMRPIGRTCYEVILDGPVERHADGTVVSEADIDSWTGYSAARRRTGSSAVYRFAGGKARS